MGFAATAIQLVEKIIKHLESLQRDNERLTKENESLRGGNGEAT